MHLLELLRAGNWVRPQVIEGSQSDEVSYIEGAYFPEG